VLTSASLVNQLSGVVVAEVLPKALHILHVWQDLPMKYIVLFGERIKTTSCKILQASLISSCRNSPIPRYERRAIIVVSSQDTDKIFVCILKRVPVWHFTSRALLHHWCSVAASLLFALVLGKMHVGVIFILKLHRYFYKKSSAQQNTNTQIKTYRRAGNQPNTILPARKTSIHYQQG
jgi:hypothetical protein